MEYIGQVLFRCRSKLPSSDLARPLAEQALIISEAALGPDHPTVAIRLSNLALIIRRLGHLEEARPLAERAVAISEAALGPDHPDVAIRLNNLAAIVADLGCSAAQPCCCCGCPA